MTEVTCYTPWADPTRDACDPSRPTTVQQPQVPIRRNCSSVTHLEVPGGGGGGGKAAAKKAVRFSTAVLMQQAVEEGDLQELNRFFLEYGVGILDERDPSGLTPVMRAILEGQMGSLAFLVEAGADLGARSPDGWTPLHVAAAADNTNAARYVAERSSAAAEAAGAGEEEEELEEEEDLAAAKNASGERPIDLARSLEMASLLVDVGLRSRARAAGATRRSGGRVKKEERGGGADAEHDAALTEMAKKYCGSSGDGDVFNSILSARTAYGSLLHLGAERNYILLLQYLLESAVIDPDVRDREGRTPLHIAASTNNAEAFLLLVMHGASLTAPDRNMRRPCELTKHETIRKLELLCIESRTEML